MMTKERLKEIADGAATKALNMLQADGELAPVVLAVGGDGRLTPTVIGADMTPEETADLMRELAGVSEAVIYITDTWTIDVKEGEKIPEDVSKHPTAVEAVVCVAHMKGYSALRRRVYTRDGGVAVRLDMGWEENPPISPECRYNNPYTA